MTTNVPAVIPASDGQKKLAKLQALSDAIRRARSAQEAEPSWYNAANLQHLINQRDALQGLTKPRLVVVN